jgi:hypothetical protein
MILLEAARQHRWIHRAGQFECSSFNSGIEEAGNLAASEYAVKHTCLPPTGHAIKCFIFVLFGGEISTFTALV